MTYIFINQLSIIAFSTRFGPFIPWIHLHFWSDVTVYVGVNTRNPLTYKMVVRIKTSFSIDDHNKRPFFNAIINQIWHLNDAHCMSSWNYCPVIVLRWLISQWRNWLCPYKKQQVHCLIHSLCLNCINCAVTHTIGDSIAHIQNNSIDSFHFAPYEINQFIDFTIILLAEKKCTKSVLSSSKTMIWQKIPNRQPRFRGVWIIFADKQRWN